MLMNCTGIWKPPIGNACEVIAGGLQEAEEQAGEERRPGAPVGEDQRRQRHEAASPPSCRARSSTTATVEMKAPAMPQSTPAMITALVAQARHRDAGRVHRMRVLAHGAQPQAEARAVQRPGGERHQQRWRHRRGSSATGRPCARSPRTGTSASAAAPGMSMGRKRPSGGSDGVRPPSLNQVIAQHHGKPCRQHVDGDAGDHLVAALVDRGIAMHQRKAHRDEDGEEESDPGRAIDRRGRGRDEGGGQHLALEPDVDDAGPFRPQAREAGQHQRHRAGGWWRRGFPT